MYFVGSAAHDSYLTCIRTGNEAESTEPAATKRKKVEDGVSASPGFTKGLRIEDRIYSLCPILDCVVSPGDPSAKGKEPSLILASGHGRLGAITSVYVIAPSGSNG